MADIWGLMLDRVVQRHENYNVIYSEILPPIDHFDEPTIWTPTTRIGRVSKDRWLLDRGLQFVPDINVKETASSLARDYLYCKYNGPPPALSGQIERIEAELKPYNMPGYSKPGSFPHGYYIDIASAYWSILMLWGWDVDYWPSKWLYQRGPVPIDFPYQHNKVSRNCLVSLAQTSRLKLWSPGKGHHEIAIPNSRINWQIMCLIKDVLNGVASEAVNAGAVYVNTDGYIAPNKKVAKKIKQIILDWGLEYRVKYEGMGWVKNGQSYCVGSKITKVQGQEKHYHDIKELNYHHWLRRRMAWQRSEKDHYFQQVVKQPVYISQMMGTLDSISGPLYN